MPEQRPGPKGGRLNSGGNEGNVYGAGAPKREFRLAAGKAALARLSYWIKVEAGHKVIRVPPLPGMVEKKPVYRYPTQDERERAYKDILLRYGIGTQDEVVVLGNEETYRAVAIAMKAEGHEKEAIAAVLVRLREAFGEAA